MIKDYSPNTIQPGKLNDKTKIKKTMKTILFILIFPLAALLPGKELKAQVFDIKPWSGTYPDMQGTYPLSFIAFKGWLIPVPHVFIRTWPTHYYVEVVALPVYDTEGYAGLLKG